MSSAELKNQRRHLGNKDGSEREKPKQRDSEGETGICFNFLPQASSFKHLVLLEMLESIRVPDASLSGGREAGDAAVPPIGQKGWVDNSMNE